MLKENLLFYRAYISPIHADGRKGKHRVVQESWRSFGVANQEPTCFINVNGDEVMHKMYNKIRPKNICYVDAKVTIHMEKISKAFVEEDFTFEY